MLWEFQEKREEGTQSIFKAIMIENYPPHPPSPESLGRSWSAHPQPKEWVPMASVSAESWLGVPHVFIHLFRSAWTHYFFLYLDYNPVLFCLFCCSDCSSFGPWSSLCWLLVSLMYSHHCGFSVWLCFVFSIFLLPGTASCSILIWYFSCQNPEISHLFQEALTPFSAECCLETRTSILGVGIAS